MSPIVLRDMAPPDVPVVVAIERASYSVPWSEATFRGLLRRRDAEMIVATREDVIIGYAVLWCVLDQAELGNVAVTAAARGAGVGEMLVREMIGRAAGRCVREVFLEVRPSNDVARRLYERLGFMHVGRRRNYYQEPVEDALVLRRPIDMDNPMETDGAT
jgi:[ribosomal protein S18]-alanine N-acetyltransferase